MHDISLKEKVEHGSSFRPIHIMHFDQGMDSFFVPNHWHDEVEILYIERGRFRLERNMRTEQIMAGDICFISSQEIHQLMAVEPNTVHSAVVFHPRMLSFELFDESQSYVINPLLAGETTFPDKIVPSMECYGEIKEGCRLILEAAQIKNNGWYLRSKASLLTILAVLEENSLLRKTSASVPRSETEKVERMKKMLAYIEAHYFEKLYTSDLAGLLNMNEQYFCRFFKTSTGQTPTEYLNRYRIEKAAQALKESNKKVLEISMECGFGNFSYFIKKFCEYKRMTPGSYRKIK